MGKRMRLALPVLAATALTILLAGCSQGDTVKAANTIHAYLPAVMGLANDAAAIVSGLEPAEATKIQAVSAKVQAELQELATVCGAYAAAPTGGGWSRLQSVVDALVGDADQGLLAALEIKNPESQAKVKVALSALDAAVHVLDGYLLAARTPAEEQAAAARRTVKLQMVVRYWSPEDWRRAEWAFGAPGEVLCGAETAAGF